MAMIAMVTVFLRVRLRFKFENPVPSLVFSSSEDISIYLCTSSFGVSGFFFALSFSAGFTCICIGAEALTWFQSCASISI